MEKRKLQKSDLLIYKDFASDEHSQSILQQTYDILNNTNKYITNELKEKLKSIGYIEHHLTFTTLKTHEYFTSSGQIDILDREILRIGLGQESKYTIRWLEIPIKLL